MAIVRKIVVGAIAFFSCLNSIGQTPTNLSSDSLLKVLSGHSMRDTSRVLILNQLSFMGYYSDPVGSLKYSFEARRIADSLHFTRGEADAFRQIGLAFWAQADISTAIKYYLTGLRIAETNHHRQVEADIVANIGTAYNGLGNPQEGLKFLNRSREMQRELHNPWREAAVTNNIGDSYLAMRQLDKAAEAYTMALNNAQRIGYNLGITTNLRNLADVFVLREKYDSALRKYLKCINLSTKIKDNRGFILSHKSIALLYFKKGDTKKAKLYAQVGLEAALKSNLRAFARDLYELQYKISEAEGDPKKSFSYFKLFSAYKDSVQNIKVVSEVDGQRLRFETEKKQSEIELLKKDSELKSERLSNSSRQLTLSIVITILSLLSLALAVWNFLKMKKVNVLLGEKNKEIQKQHMKLSEQNDELSTLNEEIRSQQEEVMAQRDSLADKNLQIEKINQKLAEVNESLEHIVDQRTNVLKEQNQKLAEYAFINAHNLRAPLARVMGLVNLLLDKPEPEEQPVILNHLKTSSEDLDSVVKSIRDAINEGISAYEAGEIKD